MTTFRHPLAKSYQMPLSFIQGLCPLRCAVQSLFFLIVLSAAGTSFGQTKPQTYAIVVGISEYADQGIESLEFAHRDALEFTKYLRSKAGGQVPESHIKMLLNKKASWSAIYLAMDETLEKCQSGDVVYFYFSGHGDIENNRIYKLGYLICHNTPRNNYVNSALRIEDLNNFANTLSVEKKVKVILITDACHSGKLAGNQSGGSFLVADQLRTVFNQEARLTSCLPEQVSLEDKSWGGGRSVFSYYLLNGLRGLADLNKDQKITLQDLNLYMTNSLSKDPVLRSRKLKQTPVIKGQMKMELTRVDTATLRALQKKLPLEENNPPSGNEPAALGKRNASYLYECLQVLKSNPEDWVANLNPSDSNNTQNVLYSILEAQLALIYSSFIRNLETEKLQQYLRDVTNNPDALQRYGRDLANRFAERGQEIITGYQQGDEAELEKRRYYNSLNNNFSQVVKMLQCGMRLCDPKSPLYRNLQVYSWYFNGIATRLTIYQNENRAPILDSAERMIQQALRLQNNASYLHHELGSIYLQSNRYAEARKSYEKATQITPGWFLPWIGLSQAYLRLRDTASSWKALQTAIEIKPDFTGAYNLMGQHQEFRKNFLLAEQNYVQSTRNNDRHFYPFEKLAFLNLRWMEFETAEMFFKESEKRKAGFNVVDTENDGTTDVLDDIPGYESNPPCTWPDTITAEDVLSQFILGMTAYKTGQHEKAEEHLLRCMQLDPSHPLAAHYLGILYRSTNQYAESAFYLKRAKRVSLSLDYLRVYVDSAKIKLHPASPTCIAEHFLKAYYPQDDDYYHLAYTYRLWNKPKLAIREYEELLKKDVRLFPPYYLIWSCYESLKQYALAEQTLQRFSRNTGSKEAINELSQFYRRMEEREEEPAEWMYKAGLFHYDQYFNDGRSSLSKQRQPMPDSLHVWGNEIASKDTARIMPGTKEIIPIAGAVYYPEFRALHYLRKAARFTLSNKRASDCYTKMAELFESIGYLDSAALYYRKAMESDDENKDVREQLVQVLLQDQLRYDAMLQMDTLNNESGLNTDWRVTYVKYKIKSGQIQEADSLLKEVKFLKQNTTDSILELKILNNYFQANWNAAIPQLLNRLKNDKTNAQLMYALARLYHFANENEKALQWLKNSIESGFSFYYVLNQDPVWNTLKNQQTWIELASKIEKPTISAW